MDDKELEVEDAPSYFGTVSYTIQSQVASGGITASVNLAGQYAPETLLIRLRDPDAKAMRTVTVNGKEWTDFNAAKEWTRIKNPSEHHYEIVANY